MPGATAQVSRSSTARPGQQHSINIWLYTDGALKAGTVLRQQHALCVWQHVPLFTLQDAVLWCAVCCAGALMVGDTLFRSADGRSHCPVCKGKVRGYHSISVVQQFSL